MSNPNPKYDIHSDKPKVAPSPSRSNMTTQNIISNFPIIPMNNGSQSPANRNTIANSIITNHQKLPASFLNKPIMPPANSPYMARTTTLKQPYPYQGHNFGQPLLFRQNMSPRPFNLNSNVSRTPATSTYPFVSNKQQTITIPSVDRAQQRKEEIAKDQEELKEFADFISDGESSEMDEGDEEETDLVESIRQEKAVRDNRMHFSRLFLDDEAEEEEEEEQVKKVKNPRSKTTGHSNGGILRGYASYTMPRFEMGSPGQSRFFCVNIPVDRLGMGSNRNLSSLCHSDFGRKYVQLLGLFCKAVCNISKPPEKKTSGKRGRKDKEREDDEDGNTYSTGKDAASHGCFVRDGKWIKHSKHYLETIRSEDGYLLWVRVIFEIVNPDINFMSVINQVIQDNMVLKQKQNEKSSKPKPQARVDNPKDYRCYRMIGSTDSLCKLMDSYVRESIFSVMKDTGNVGSLLDPLVSLNMLNESSLVEGIPSKTVKRAPERFTTTKQYFDKDDNFIKKQGFEFMSVGVDQLDPQTICGRPIPSQTNEKMMKRAIMGSKDGSSDSDLVEEKTPDQIYKEKVSEYLSKNSKNLISANAQDYEKLSKALKELKVSTDANLDGKDSYFDPDTAERTEWECKEEGDDVNIICNKAVQKRGKNFKILREILEKYTIGTEEYNEAISTYKERACQELVDDLENVLDNTDEWDDIFKLMFTWYKENSQDIDHLWPECNRGAKGLSIFGNAMVQEIVGFINCFELVPGWKPLSLQKYAMIQLDALSHRFDIHLNALLSGGASLGKSHLLECLIKMRILDTVIHATSITEKAFTTNGRYLNYKTLAFEEAPPFILGMSSNSGPTGSNQETRNQSYILKDVLARCATLSMRNLWDSETGQAKLCVSKATLILNVLAATNSGRAVKDSPLVKRLMPEDVISENYSDFGVREIAFKLDGQKENITRQNLETCKKFEQFLQFLAEVHITAGAICDVNVDIPVIYMLDVFKMMKERHGIPLPDIRMMGNVVKACRVMTIQHAIRVCYFSEIGQLNQQFARDDDEEESILVDASGDPILKPFDMSTFGKTIEPYLYCTEEIFAYVMTMLTAHLVPRTDGIVLNALREMCYSENVSLKETKKTNEAGVWYQKYDSNYYGFVVPSKSKFFQTVAEKTGGKVNKVTVETIIGEISSKFIRMRKLPAVKRKSPCDFREPYTYVSDAEYQRRNDMGSLYLQYIKHKKKRSDSKKGNDSEEKMEFPEELKAGYFKALPIHFENMGNDKNNLQVCIARELIEQEIPIYIPVINYKNGDIVKGYPKIFDYENAIKRCLEDCMSHYGTRERRILLSKTYCERGTHYPSLLDYIDLKRNPKRVIIKQNHIRKDTMFSMFVGNSRRTKKGTASEYAPISVFDGDIEMIVAKNHCMKIGREFEPEFLPQFQDVAIKQIRKNYPQFFNTMIDKHGTNEEYLMRYPEDFRDVINAEKTESDIMTKHIEMAASKGKLDVLLNNPSYKNVSMSRGLYVGQDREEDEQMDPERDALSQKLDELIAETLAHEEQKTQINYEKMKKLGNLDAHSTKKDQDIEFDESEEFDTYKTTEKYQSRVMESIKKIKKENELRSMKKRKIYDSKMQSKFHKLIGSHKTTDTEKGKRQMEHKRAEEAHKNEILSKYSVKKHTVQSNTTREISMRKSGRSNSTLMDRVRSLQKKRIEYMKKYDIRDNSREKGKEKQEEMDTDINIMDNVEDDENNTSVVMEEYKPQKEDISNNESSVVDIMSNLARGNSTENENTNDPSHMSADDSSLLKVSSSKPLSENEKLFMNETSDNNINLHGDNAMFNEYMEINEDL